MFLHETLSANQIKRHLKQEFSRGLTESGSLGYHGTSIYTILYCLKFGVLPGATDRDTPRTAVDPDNGDLYFWKIDNSKYDYDPISLASSYASSIAQRHHLIEILGLDRANLNHQKAAMEFLYDHPEFRKGFLELIGLEMNPEDLEGRISKAYDHKGVIIGIDQSVTAEFGIVDMESYTNDDGWKIQTNGRGLPFNYIRGISALGEIEQNIFLNF